MALFNFFKRNKDKTANEEENTAPLTEEAVTEEETEETEETESAADEKSEEDPDVVYEDITDISEIMPEEEENANISEPEPQVGDSDDELAWEKEEQSAEEKKQGFFSKIKKGLLKTRNNILSGIEQVLGGFSEIDDDLYDELEEALIMADIGVETSCAIIDKVRKLVKEEKIKEVYKVRELIVRVISDMLVQGDSPLELPSPSVLLVIGVNGVGKTTTIGKLTSYYKNEGKSVMLAAADTFRAAAIDQLMVWGERSNTTVIRHSENSDPAAVVFDAAAAAKNRNIDILICDTAGRLHNKKNLMNELAKISRVISREYENAHKEVFLVLDATTGQNALQQAKLFKEAADITGIILTKLDGTAKGGIIIAIKNELQIPIRFIGVGEGIDDLRPFNAEEFAKALFE